ncbi:hypothetical protein A2810_00180 [candidate division Kazan bacterium RIFCSPHIGHO2_01_FULL_49_10]|nr:MAG: hypothetical protein A2810_00180 [candidate division Kazan bacterium RIFCSPHIGHO2_01_FULL_49_10]
MRSIQYLQLLVLLGGVLFAWNVVADDIARGFNPLKVMCFYGALGLSIAFLSALYILFTPDKIDQLWQRFITWLLGLGTIFAWGNWSYVAYKLFRGETCPSACPVTVTNPFFSPCFYGALIYLAAFLIALFLLRRDQRKTQ